MQAQKLIGERPECVCQKCKQWFYEPKAIVNPDFPKGEDAWIKAHRENIPYEILVCPHCGNREIIDHRPPKKHTFP
jgi:hypothetical protein